MPEFIDDKSEHCIPFLLERLKIHQERHAGDPDPPPFFLGLNGVQGAGKTTLVCTSLRFTGSFGAVVLRRWISSRPVLKARTWGLMQGIHFGVHGWMDSGHTSHSSDPVRETIIHSTSVGDSLT